MKNELSENEKKLEKLLLDYVEKEISKTGGEEPAAVLPRMIDKLLMLWDKF